MRDPEWCDLFYKRGTRRDFLRVGRAAAGLLALASVPGCRADVRLRSIGSYPFKLGVASGDPSITNSPETTILKRLFELDPQSLHLNLDTQSALKLVDWIRGMSTSTE